jgi:DNA adenine methylase
MGGKGRLLDAIVPLIPKEIDRYFEPFVGGGSVFFALAPRKATINDANEELTNFYVVLRDDVEGIVAKLNELPVGKDGYAFVRDLDRKEGWRLELGCVGRAARFVYLNRTCFNGMWRVNRFGHNNIPWGKTEIPNFQIARLREASIALRSCDVEITCLDFENACADAKEGDFVYFDPPYIPLSESESFVGYTADGFDWSSQLRLKGLCDALTSKGVKFMLSNSSAPASLKLYESYNVRLTPIKRLAGGKGSERKSVNEILVTNY